MSTLSAVPIRRTLGDTDIEVSSIAWGMWRFHGDDLRAARALVDAAFDAGITLFDTADIYGVDQGGFGAAELLLGRLFAADRELRSRMVLATKGGIVLGVPYDSSPDYLGAAIDISLKRLQVEQIDLWQVHRPDILTHPQEVARAMEDAQRAGKVRAFGVSNHTVDQIEALQAALPFALVSSQPELSPFRIDPIENGELDQAMRRNLAVLAWSPLGGGRISQAGTPREQAVIDELDRIAAQFAVSRAAVAYSWIMAHPARPIPIVGSQQPHRIAEAADAFKVVWTRTDWYKVFVAAKGAPLP